MCLEKDVCAYRDRMKDDGLTQNNNLNIFLLCTVTTV
jgi:hypothetical protein